MRIKAIQRRFPQFQELEIYGLGDLHIGSREFNQRDFKEVVLEILEKENRYCVVLGDVVDNGLENSKTSPYSQVMTPHEQRDCAVELLSPLKERILGWTDGNHEQRTSRYADVDVSYLIADRIGVEGVYRPGICPLMLYVGERKNHRSQPPNYSVGVTHGSSGGVTLGAGLTKAESFALANGFDIMVVGHSHKPSTAPSVRFYSDYREGYMVGKIIRIMVCTGWLDYGTGSYAVAKMYKPVAIKPNKLILSGLQYDVSVLS
jgi:predicted phosphodiesterase